MPFLIVRLALLRIINIIYLLPDIARYYAMQRPKEPNGVCFIIHIVIRKGFTYWEGNVERLLQEV